MTQPDIKALEGSKMKKTPYWTEDREAELSRLWDLGKTANEIAVELGGDITKNGVIGKAHRLNLKRRANPVDRTIIKDGKEKRRIARIATSVLRRERKYATFKEYKHTAYGPPTKLEDLARVGQCRWPIGDPKKSDFHFCAASCGEKTYCDNHSKLAYSNDPREYF